jgi:hypothetical protein
VVADLEAEELVDGGEGLAIVTTPPRGLSA